MQKPLRLGGLDDLRWTVIVLVVLVHANVTYSGIGSWYYVETATDSLDTVAKALMALTNAFSQAWFMGVLFLVSGLFVSSSLQKKGIGLFLGERAVRLLVPLAAYLLLIHPAMLAVFGRGWYPRDIIDVLSGSGPLWFTAALFAFTALAAGLQYFMRPFSKPSAVWPAWLWLLLAGVIAAAAWLVRIPFPIGSSVVNFQWCFFASYIVLFAAGWLMGRNGGLQTLPASWGRLSWMTPLISLPVLLVFFFFSGTINGDRSLVGGGSFNSAGYALWESATAVAMSLGLLVRARERSRLPRIAAPAAWRRWLRENSFGVFVLHAPVLWGFSLLVASWHVWAPLKAVVVAAVVLVLTLGLVRLIRLVPGVRSVLS